MRLLSTKSLGVAFVAAAGVGVPAVLPATAYACNSAHCYTFITGNTYQGTREWGKAEAGEAGYTGAQIYNHAHYNVCLQDYLNYSGHWQFNSRSCGYSPYSATNNAGVSVPDDWRSAGGCGYMWARESIHTYGGFGSTVWNPPKYC